MWEVRAQNFGDINQRLAQQQTNSTSTMNSQHSARISQTLKNCIHQAARCKHVPVTTLLRPATLQTSRAFSSTTPRPHNPTPNSTVDPTEVSHFNALASSWWDPHGPSRLLHLMNPLRHDFISQCRSNDLTPPSQKLRYLDIGCGGGIFAESAARLPNTLSVTAIDPTPEVLKNSRGP